MILNPFQWGACNGCGELYLGDFHSNPPDCCDPCDCYGNWTGGPPPMVGYQGGPAPVGPAAPAGTCPTCGQVHAGNGVNPGYTSSQAPPGVVSQTRPVVAAAPTQAAPRTSYQPGRAVTGATYQTSTYAPQTSMVPASTVRR